MDLAVSSFFWFNVYCSANGDAACRFILQWRSRRAFMGGISSCCDEDCRYWGLFCIVFLAEENWHRVLAPEKRWKGRLLVWRALSLRVIVFIYSSAKGVIGDFYLGKVSCLVLGLILGLF